VTTAVESSAAEKGGRKPERSCAACRRTSSPDALLRLVRTPDGRIAVDWRRKLGGRGAHVCPTRGCIAAAIKGRALDRAFHAEVEYPDVDELIAAARDGLSRRLGALLGSALGARRLAVGSDAVDGALARGQVACILVAGDAANREDLVRRGAELGVPTRAMSDKESLGEILGRRPTAVMALGDRGLASAVLETLERLEALQ
jgi:uncharacterized protein